jgi:MFS family permease
MNNAKDSASGSLPPSGPASVPSHQSLAASANTGETYSLTGPAAMTPSEFDGNSMRAAVSQPEMVEAGGHSGKPLAKNSLWVLIGCNVLVFLSSVCVMVLELTASRLIAKHVGSSLYTWTSVIGVVLAGITIGNFLGGWLADKGPPSKLLNWLFLTASILCLSVLWLDGVAAGQERPESWSWPVWVLCVVGMVFFLPSMALGTISPVVASLALSHSRKVGRTVGNVYAWGAFGSIVGTFLGGFILIDHFGTRAIVALVAGTLAVMGALSAGGQWAFRSAVLFGWMQFVTWIGLSASITEAGMRDLAEQFGRLATLTEKDFDRSLKLSRWTTFGGRFGRLLHEMGLTLGLREDNLGEYHDESNYSYINVTQQTENGQRVAVLKLDKLIHSYYVTDDPNQLNYDYEKVYAAVTEQAVATWDRTTTVRLDEARNEISQWQQERAEVRHPLPPDEGRGEGLDALDQDARKLLDADAKLTTTESNSNSAENTSKSGNVLQQLPSWVTFDAEKQTLSLRGGMTSEMRDELLRRHPYSSYWQAVERLAEMTRRSDWGDFGSVPLASLPSGIAFPEELRQRVLYDRHLQALNVYRGLPASDVQTLLRLGDLEAVTYRETVERLYGRSRRIGTLFLGGGGFVFPRWIESLFPHDPLIHVAELDPAVKAAVQARMNLPSDDQTRVQTTIGDARNFVDDRVRYNQAAIKRGEQPVLYDFIYGDAFNDFSVPWHLTTREFSEKISSLLHPTEGIYLVNLIDIYPRTEYPTHQKLANGSFSQIGGVLPEVLTRNADETEEWASAPAPFEGIEVSRTADYAGFRMAVRGVMSDKLRDRLLKLANGKPEFAEAVRTLYDKSHKQRTGRFLGSYVNTIGLVFPNVYVFSSEIDLPHANRDTFVIVASKRKLNLTDLRRASSHWSGAPFATLETVAQGQPPQASGQMSQILSNAYGIVLTDNYAPVDNLLSSVFDER